MPNFPSPPTHYHYANYGHTVSALKVQLAFVKLGNWNSFLCKKHLTSYLLISTLTWAIGLLFGTGQPTQASAGPVPISLPARRTVTNISSLTITNPALVSPCTPFDGCSGPNCPGTYPGTVSPVDPPNEGYSGTDDNFNVIVKGNFIVPVDGGAETEGRVLVGGNFSMNRDYYGAGTSGGGTFVVGPDGEANLIVRGAIQRTAGTAGVLGNSQAGNTPLIGKILVGSSVPATITPTSGNAADIQANQGATAINALVNVNAVLANLVTKSACYTNSTPTGTFNTATLTLTGDNTSSLQVFNLTSANLSALVSQNLLFKNIPAGATIIINVAGSIIDWQVANVAASIPNDPNYSLYGLTDPDVDVRKVLFNFGQATSVTFNSSINGSVLVPSGDVILNGNLNGRLAVGGNLTHSGEATEIHNYPFNGDCSCASCSLAVTITPGSCNTATNQYTLTGVVNLTNATVSSLSISDGTATTTVSVSAGQTSVPYSLTGLLSGTGSHTVTVISSATTCSTASQTYTAPASCLVRVSLLVTDPGTCQPATNNYTTTGIISLTNAVAGMALVTDGALTTAVSITAGQTSAIYSLTGLTSGTGSHTVVVNYATKTASTTYFSPASCTVGMAVSVTPGTCQTATNQYSISGTLSLTNAVAGAATITDGAIGTTVSVSAGATTIPFSLTGLASNGAGHTVMVSYAGQTVQKTYTAPVSCVCPPAKCVPIRIRQLY